MTTADMSLVAKESMLVEKLKNNTQSHFFVRYCTCMRYFQFSVLYKSESV